MYNSVYDGPKVITESKCIKFNESGDTLKRDVQYKVDQFRKLTEE